MRSLHQALPAAAIALLLLSTTAFAQDASGYTELPRFQQVSERLYRGAQPRDGGLSRLREFGINTVINLRGTSKQTRVEEAEARALGLNYYNVALPNWGRPQDARVGRILQIIAAPENGRVFVHCRTGVDRTGMIVSIYRMTHEGWNRSDALAEAERNGMRRFQYWMRDYAKEYEERMGSVGPKSTDEDFDDRIGAGMRIMERETFRVRKVASRFLRKLSASLR